jgi:hypothetical protein
MLRVPEVFVPAQPQKPTPGSARRGASGAGKQSSEDQGPEDAASQQDIGTPAGTGGTSAGAGGDGGEHPEAADQQADDGDDPRRVAHELLGQAHAVLVIATRDGVIEYWCPEDLRGSFLDARDPLWIAIGNAEVEIGSGEHDAGLLQAGIGGRVSRHKRRGLRKALERLTGVVTTGNARLIRAWLKSAAGLARTAVGSMVREIPGGEIIAEALDGILAGIDTTEALEITQSTEQ